MIRFPLKAILCLFLYTHLSTLSCEAQVFSNDGAVREANFVTKVVQLDEFIHRFNNDSSSAICRYYLDHHRPWNKSREQLIRSLFNYSTQHWDSLKVNHFIGRATDADSPDSLGFLRGQWFAEAHCHFLYHAEPVEANLILRLQVNPNGSSQWVIAAVKPGFVIAKEKRTPLPQVIPVNRKLRFIQPAANDTYFSELERDFADKRNLPDLFDKQFLARRHSGAFYQALLNNRIRFVAVKKLKYHYLQVHDWIFTVENFERRTRNSGWLITSIREVNDEERSDYVKKLLQE